MLRGIAVGIVLAVAVALLAGYLAIRVGLVPANADARPPRLERWIAGTSLHATLRRDAPRTNDPLPLTDSNVIAGIKLYAQNCAVCHGDSSGKPTNIARGLYQKPPQLGKDGVEDDPAGIIYWKVKHGIRWTGMPAFGPTLSETQLWKLTLFLKTMDRLPPAAESLWRKVKA